MADATRLVNGEPSFLPTLVADKVTGLLIAQAISAALFRRERTGEGQEIEVPMIDAATAFTLVEHGAGAIPTEHPVAAGYPRILSAHRRPHPTKDGWVAILPYSLEHYEAFFAATGLLDEVDPAMYADGRTRIARSDVLYGYVRRATPSRTTAEWLELCRELQIPASAVATLDELVAALPVVEHPVVGPYRADPGSGPLRRHGGRGAAARCAARGDTARCSASSGSPAPSRGAARRRHRRLADGSSHAGAVERRPSSADVAAGHDADRCVEPEAGVVPLVLALATPEPVLVVHPGELLALPPTGAAATDGRGLGLARSTVLGSLAARGEEEMGQALAGRGVHPRQVVCDQSDRDLDSHERHRRPLSCSGTMPPGNPTIGRDPRHDVQL